MYERAFLPRHEETRDSQLGGPDGRYSGGVAVATPGCTLAGRTVSDAAVSGCRAAPARPPARPSSDLHPSSERCAPPRSGIRMMMTPGSILDYTETGNCIDTYLGGERSIVSAFTPRLITLPEWLRNFKRALDRYFATTRGAALSCIARIRLSRLSL